MKSTLFVALLVVFSASAASAYDMVHAGWVAGECDRGASASESTWCEDMGNGSGGSPASWFAEKWETQAERIARIRAAIPQFSLVGLFKAPDYD